MEIIEIVYVCEDKKMKKCIVDIHDNLSLTFSNIFPI